MTKWKPWPQNRDANWTIDLANLSTPTHHIYIYTSSSLYSPLIVLLRQTWVPITPIYKDSFLNPNGSKTEVMVFSHQVHFSGRVSAEVLGPLRFLNIAVWSQALVSLLIPIWNLVKKWVLQSKVPSALTLWFWGFSCLFYPRRRISFDSVGLAQRFSVIAANYSKCCLLPQSHSLPPLQYVNVEPIEYISVTQRSALISIRNRSTLSWGKKYNLYALEFCFVCMCTLTTMYSQHFYTVEYMHRQNSFLHLFITM